jgi:hypothetical protein
MKVNYYLEDFLAAYLKRTPSTDSLNNGLRQGTDDNAESGGSDHAD